MPYRVALLGLAALASALLAAVPPAHGAGSRPNVVLVLTDDHRWDQLAAMPTVQRELVARGVRFANAFVVNPICCPSRASILTGRYSHSTGVYGNQPPHGGAGAFDDSDTLATWLSAAGYRTAFMGKYLNGYPGGVPPPGWTRWLAYTGGPLGRGLDIEGFTIPYRWGAEPGATDLLGAHAATFVGARSRRPFFLLLAPYAPHLPTKPAERHAGSLAHAWPLRAPSFDEVDVSDRPRWLAERARLSQRDEHLVDVSRRRQLESLLAVDDAVETVLAALAGAGRLANTLVFFTADNGLLLGEHREVRRKVSPYEESIRVPLVARWDALRGPRRTESRLALNIDLAPTIAAAAGLNPPGLEGRNLLPLLRGETRLRWRTRFLVEHLQGTSGAASEVPTYCAVRDQRFKYVAYATGEEELYDLARDRYELENRARDRSFHGTLARLRTDVARLCDPRPPGLLLGVHDSSYVSSSTGSSLREAASSSSSLRTSSRNRSASSRRT